jgi:hypothetical protein
VPPDAGGREGVVDRVTETRVQRGSNSRLRYLRVDVQRGSKRRGGLEDWPVVTVVEVALASAAEEKGTIEAELRDRALELVGGGGCGGGERSEAWNRSGWALTNATIWLFVSTCRRVASSAGRS